MRMKSFAALAGGGTDGDDASGFLRDHLLGGEVGDSVNTFEVDAQHVVPFALGEIFDGSVFDVPDAGVGDEDVELAETLNGIADEALGVGHAGEVGLERFDARAVLASFLLDLTGGVAALVVAEDNVSAGLREELHRCGANAARAAGDECCFACERNHKTPKSRPSTVGRKL